MAVLGAVSILESTLFKDPNLSNYWAMDGSSGATTGSTSGTDTSISYETQSPFTTGSSAALDARTDKITLGTGFAPRAIDGTIYAWVYPTSTGITGDADYKFTSWYSKGNVYGRIGHISGNYVRIYYYNSGGSQVNFNSNGTLTLNAWNQVVYTWTNGSSKIYINGLLDITDGAKSFYDMNSGGDTGLNTVGVGEEAAANNYGYLGYVDDLAFFNRQLTAAEISTLYFTAKQRIQMII